MTGKDTYFDGHGRMLGKLGGLITVVDGKGEEFDISELTTKDRFVALSGGLRRAELRTSVSE